MPQPNGKPLRVVSVVEGTWVTGPIKPLIMFAKMARSPAGPGRTVDLSVVATYRGEAPNTSHVNPLSAAIAAESLRIDLLHERHAGDLRVLDALARVISDAHPDIVETHQVKSHFLLAQAMLWRKLRRSFSWIAYHHGYTGATAKLVLYEQLDRWSLRRADRVVTVCEPFAAALVKRGVRGDRISVISNAVEQRPVPDADALLALRAKLGLQPKERVVLTVGRLSKEKGHENLVNAFGVMACGAGLHDSPRLLVIGDGPERSNLERAAQGFSDRVLFLGHQADVWPFYFIADVFALPSLTEGSPLVLLEAMAARRTILATSVGGVPETVEHGVSALLVPPDDVATLTSELQRLLDEPALRERLAVGAAAAHLRCSPEVYRDRLRSLYETVLAR